MKTKVMFPTVEEMAEMLYQAGWTSPCDAQWEGLSKVLIDIREIIESESEKRIVAGEGLEGQTRNAWEMGFRLCRRYGDNHIHFDGEQKEKAWERAKAELKVS